MDGASFSSRLEYYIGSCVPGTNVQLSPELYDFRYYDSDHDEVQKSVCYEGDPLKTRYSCIREAREKVREPFQRYYTDLSRFMNPHAGVLVVIGDCEKCQRFPCIAKTRPVGCGNNALLPLDDARHMRHVPELLNGTHPDDIPFDQKENTLVWRGGRTGDWESPQKGRRALVEKYALSSNSHIDVGFTPASTKAPNVQPFLDYLKPKLSLEQQLRARFIVSAEGNDVATNLKWVLASNSVPVMPLPTICSWIMEDRLVPWRHFIPVNADYSDLEEKRAWGAAHPQACARIARNGKEYMRQFMNPHTEWELACRVVSTWADNVTLVQTRPEQRCGDTVINVKKFSS